MISSLSGGWIDQAITTAPSRAHARDGTMEIG
jgi:hypothetical protein